MTTGQGVEDKPPAIKPLPNCRKISRVEMSSGLTSTRMFWHQGESLESSFFDPLHQTRGLIPAIEKPLLTIGVTANGAAAGAQMRGIKSLGGPGKASW
jgi:hypothetical protein